MSEQKHVVLFISSLRKGGAERVMVNLAAYLQRNGVRVTVVTQYPKPADSIASAAAGAEGEVQKSSEPIFGKAKMQAEYELPSGIPRIISDITQDEVTGNRIGDVIARYRKLRRIWKEQNPDVILSFIGKNNIMAILAAAFTGIPVVVSVRGEPKEEYASRAMRAIVNPVFARAAGVVLQTRDAFSFFSPKVQKKAMILRNPLNPAFVRPRYEGERDKTVYAVGRVDANKNHEMLIRAFAALADDFPEYRLVIYGDGECRERLKALAAELLPSDARISLPGAVDNVAERIYRGSAFVLCSYSEGMPNTLIEAMCMGIPSISTDCPCGGPAELIRDGENGLLIPVGDERALEQALRRILTADSAAANDPKRTEAGQGGRKEGNLAEALSRNAASLLQQYHPEQVGADWMNYLLRIAEKKK